MKKAAAERESNEIYETILTTEISNKDLQKRIFDLNDYWTEKMDILSVSISRKDMQPISDYLQYLCSSIINPHDQCFYRWMGSND